MPDSLKTITLHENFRALFYTPFYLSNALGAYRHEGLDLRFVETGEPGQAILDVLEGRAELAWGGPMRLLHHHDRDPACQMMGFSEVVTRDPFTLVGRAPKPNFRFSDLRGIRLGSVSEVPTPWLCLQEDLRRAGLDPDALTRISDQTMAQNTADLRDGKLDVIQVFESYVEILVAEGAGHIWHAAAARGPTSYTCFLTTRKVLQNEPETLLRVTRAMYRTQQWLHAHDDQEIACAVADYFPDLGLPALASAIARYKEAGIWGRNPLLPDVGFARLKIGLLSGGLIARDVPLESCVDNALAERIIAEAPPPL